MQTTTHCHVAPQKGNSTRLPTPCKTSSKVPILSVSLQFIIMADKEATVYIVDVGKSMGECRHGRSISDLQYSMQYVWDRITATVSIDIAMRVFLTEEGSYWS